MSYLIAGVYDLFMARVEEACLRDWRQTLLKDVTGDVLEIGAGTGANIGLYPGRIDRLVLAEPDRHMRGRLKQKVAGSGLDDVHVIDDAAECIRADDESFDCVVAALVCCSVSDLEASLREIRRVLRPGGRFLFLEHVAAAEGTSRRRWQDVINPVWRPLMGNCHLNRETEHSIRSAGFRIREIRRESMRKAIPIVRPTIRGVAVKD